MDDLHDIWINDDYIATYEKYLQIKKDLELLEIVKKWLLNFYNPKTHEFFSQVDLNNDTRIKEWLNDDK